MYAPESPSSNSRQKRVLPSRSRRGGPGVGSCDADLLILDTQKRQSENDPLIPAETEFILTTNSALLDTPSAGSPSSSVPPPNIQANERYFDRPEVLKSYREQQIIQTPEYISLSDVASVGGRFRPRGVAEEFTDTSDAAYEKRHRKYDTFEKRTRLREKEKLKHEQYKLKERIDQLRAMDGSAFMALPASSFSSLPNAPAEAGSSDSDSANALAGARVNGAAAYNEGERRRQEMLEVAGALEERFRILLPPDRIRKPPGSSNATPSIDPETGIVAENGDYTIPPEPEDYDMQIDQDDDTRDPNFSIKIKVPSRHTSSGPSQSTSSSSKLRPKRSLMPNGSSHARKLKPTPTISSPLARMILPPGGHLPLSSGVLALSPSAIAASRGGIISPTASDVPGDDPHVPQIAVLRDDEFAPSVSAGRGRPRKKPRIDEPTALQIQETTPQVPRRGRGRPRLNPSSVPPIEVISAPAPTPAHTSTAAAAHTSTTAPVPPLAPPAIPPQPSRSHRSASHRAMSRSSQTPMPRSHHASANGPPAEPPVGALLLQAMRAANTDKTRRTIRNVTAFGVKLPVELDESFEFQLPYWLIAPSEAQINDDVAPEMTVEAKATVVEPHAPVDEQPGWTIQSDIPDVPEVADSDKEEESVVMDHKDILSPNSTHIALACPE